MKIKAFVLCGSLIFLSGCSTVATKGNSEKPTLASHFASKDPFERFNRATFEFNDKFDKVAAQPVAQAYTDYVPSFIRTGVSNFFGNIGDVWTSINSFLQGNFADGLSDIMRFGLNSTFGFLGLLDIASEAQIPKHHKDLGQTLGVWGVPNGPYLVIPFLGPSVLRDTVALPVDYYADAWSYYRPVSIRNTGSVVRLVDKRSGYLGATSLLEDAALDKYTFVRDGYLQRIKGQIESQRNFKQEREDYEEMQSQNEEAEKASAATEAEVKPDAPKNAAEPETAKPEAAKPEQSAVEPEKGEASQSAAPISSNPAAPDSAAIAVEVKQTALSTEAKPAELTH